MLKFLTTTLLDTLFIAKHCGKALTLTSILGAVFGLPHLQEAQRRREAERQARERAQYLEQLAQERAHYLRQKENFIRELQLQELFKAAPHTTPYLTDREITSTMVSLDWHSRVIVGRWESEETTPGDETLILEKLMKEKEQQEPMQIRACSENMKKPFHAMNHQTHLSMGSIQDKTAQRSMKFFSIQKASEITIS